MDYFEYRDAIFASDLTSNQKLVALAISYHYNWKENKPAFPSNSTLSRETSLSIASIVRAKRVLTETGWLLIKRRVDATCEYTPCSQSSTNNEVNNEYNNELNNKSSNEDLYISNTKKNPEEIITLDINEDIPLAKIKAQAVSLWDGWR